MSLIWVICHCNHQTMNMLKMCAIPEQRYDYEMFKIIKIRLILLLTLRNIVIICICKKEVLYYIVVRYFKLVLLLLIPSWGKYGKPLCIYIYIYLFTLVIMLLFIDIISSTNMYTLCLPLSEQSIDLL